MIIPISGELRITGNSNCYQLEKKQKRKGADDWRPFKYFTRFADAVGAACEREIRVHPARGLAEAIDAAHEVAARYGELLDVALSEIAKRSEPPVSVVQ